MPSKDDDEDDLRAIAAALDRMHKVTPPDPYVLTIPQDVEPRYHHPNHPAWYGQWLKETPFVKGEHESSQYMTFVYHEHGKEIYVQHNSRPLEGASTNGASINRPRSGTGANTPSNGAPKKKISLDAYKKKLTGGSTSATEKSANKPADATPKQGAVKGPVERVKAESEEMLAAVAETEAEIAPAPAPASVKLEKQAPAQQKELKRKREEETQGKEAQVDKAERRPNSGAPKGDTEPAPKKVKKAVEEPVTNGKHGSSQQIDKTVMPSKEPSEPGTLAQSTAPLGMPPRLSPGMPEKLSPPRIKDDVKPSKRTDSKDTTELSLPSRLSPTIPDNILKTLESRSNARPSSDLSAPNSASKTKDGKLTPLTKPNGITKKKSPVPKNGFRASSSSPAVRPNVEERAAAKTLAVQRARSPELSQDEEVAVGRAIASSTQSRERLLVKFKFKKAMRESVQRILKMRPQPEKKLSPPVQKSNEEEKQQPPKPREPRNAEKTVAMSQKGVATKVGPAKRKERAQAKEEQKPSQATKRPMPDEDKDDMPAKRKKTEEPRKDPSTPASKEVDSPMTQKSTLPATPGSRKDLLSATTMQRQHSQDSVTTYDTPPAQASTPSVSVVPPSKANGIRPPSSQPSSKTPKQQAWELEQKQFHNLGREIKNAAEAERSKASKDPKARRLAAIQAVESLLCWLLAFTCADQASLAADPKQAPAWQNWRSIYGFYGWAKGCTEHFEPLAGLVCHLGVVIGARTLEIASGHPANGPSREGLLEAQHRMLKAAADAETKLGLETLQATFPKTWSARSKTLPATEDLQPGQYAGAYRLPLGLTTCPVRAARAGHAMLQEWMEKEKIEHYTLKLKL